MAPSGNTGKIENALLYKLGALTLDPTRRVAWPDDDFTPVTGEIYLTPGVLWNNSERGEIGTGAAIRHRGIFQVILRGPQIGSPSTDANVADLIIAHFDRATITRNAVTVRIGSFDGGRAVPWRGAAIPENGWRMIPVSIPFWCDVFPT